MKPVAGQKSAAGLFLPETGEVKDLRVIKRVRPPNFMEVLERKIRDPSCLFSQESDIISPKGKVSHTMGLCLLNVIFSNNTS